METKRAQLGTTMTWIPAVVIVFFVMLLFVGASLMLSKSKGTGDEALESKGTTANLYLENHLRINYFLNSKVEKDNNLYPILYLILNDFSDNKDLIQKNYDIFIARYNFPSNCEYFFLDKFYENKGFIRLFSASSSASSLTNSGIDLSLNSDFWKLNLKFYSGGCK